MNTGARSIRNRFLQFIFSIIGISFFVWAYSDIRFRDAEGFLEGGFCLLFSIGIALIIFGLGIGGRFRKSTSWFALALVGQAVALQMIEAGTHVRYQHYRSFYSLLTEIHPVLLIYFAVQTALVLAGLRTRWRAIQSWLGRNFRVWQLVGIGLVFFLSSATVSKDISKYITELIFASFVQAVNLGNIVLMAWAIPEGVLVSWKQRLGRFFSEPTKKNSGESASMDRFVIMAALSVTVLAIILSLFIYQRHPHVPDEVMYLYQARYLANGDLTVPAPPVPEAFSFYMIPHESHRWYSIFPPGWPAVLALGVLLGVPWLVNPVFAGLNVLLAYLLFQEISNRYTARIGVLLLCISPWFIFMSMSFMSHTFTLTCALAAAVAITRARRSGKTVWGLLGGFATGMVSLIRPLDGLIVAGILGLWAIGVGGRRLKTSSILAFVIGTIVVGAVILPYNKQITGDPTIFPLTSYYEEYFGPNANAFGFGPDRGLGWAIDPFPGHGAIDALVNTNLNIFSINVELFGWSTGSLIIVALLFFSRSMRRGDYLMIAMIVIISAIYSLYWFSGGPDFGARYWYLMLIPLVGLTVRAVQMLQEKFETGQSGSTINATRVIVAVLAVSMLTVINFLPWRAIDKYHHYRGMRPDIRYLAQRYEFGKSLVLIRGNYPDYQSAWAYNPLDPQADAPVYAWDQNLDVRAQLLKAYPERPVWIINGPSITNANFEVDKGPISAHELMANNM